MKVLCLTGLRGVGKDFLTRALINDLHSTGVFAYRLSFSDELRLVCNYLFPWLPADISDDIKDLPFNHPKNVCGLTPRDIWKLVAHDVTGICSVQPDVLVDSFGLRQLPVETVDNADSVFIVTDIRKLAEHKLAANRGFKIIRINPEVKPEHIDEVEKLVGEFEVNAEFCNYKDEKSVTEFISLAKSLLGIDNKVSAPFCLSKNMKEAVTESVELMFNEQSQLNAMYNSNWEAEYDVQTLFVAMVKELVEMEEEVSHINHFFGKRGSSNYSKGLEEFVDVLHYATTIAILKDSHLPYYYDISNGVREIDGLLLFTDVNPSVCGLELSTKRKLFGEIMQCVCKFQQTPNVEFLFLLGCYLFDITVSQMFCAYLHKNSKNQARVNRGAATGQVDKSFETGTYQHLFEKNIVNLHPDVYDAKLENTVGNLYAPSRTIPI